ncbi:hypothetical protein [Spirillospora sp. NPDC047279]|uniref:hypothetical protein n=1 Tax=Spirillospora sp. NPDC047279 TaxID=3155478 RepID=UPI003401F44B
MSDLPVPFHRSAVAVLWRPFLMLYRRSVLRTPDHELNEILASVNKDANAEKKTRKAKPAQRKRHFDPKSAAFAARGGASHRNARQMPTRRLQRGGR